MGQLISINRVSFALLQDNETVTETDSDGFASPQIHLDLKSRGTTRLLQRIRARLCRKSSRRLRDTPDVAAQLSSTVRHGSSAGSKNVCLLLADKVLKPSETAEALTFLLLPDSSSSRSVEGIDTWIMAQSPSNTIALRDQCV